MAIAIPSPSPRTLRRVGLLRHLVLRTGLGGPAESQGVDNSGSSRAAPQRPSLGLSLASLLVLGHFVDRDCS